MSTELKGRLFLCIIATLCTTIGAGFTWGAAPGLFAFGVSVFASVLVDEIGGKS